MGASVCVLEIQRFAIRRKLEGGAALFAGAVDQQLLAGREFSIRQRICFPFFIAELHAGEGNGGLPAVGQNNIVMHLALLVGVQGQIFADGLADIDVRMSRCTQQTAHKQCKCEDFLHSFFLRNLSLKFSLF